MEELVQWLTQAKDTYVDVYISILRYAAPALAFILLWRCLKPLLFFKREPEIWAMDFPNILILLILHYIIKNDIYTD